jgi:hypothetical protein
MRVADRVHHEALAALPEPQRELFIDTLFRLIEDQSPAPAETEHGVRRPRRRKA